MNNPNPSTSKILVQVTRPWVLVMGIFMYLVGGGINIFLGGSIHWDLFFIGLGCTTLLQASSYFLKAYYDRLDPFLQPAYKEEDTSKRLPFRSILLQISITLLTVGAVLTVLIFSRSALNLAGLFILGFAFILSFIYAVPPFRLVYSGYGELVEAFIIANLIPAFSFMLQTGEMHRLLWMLTFPVTVLHLAMLLALSLPDYGRDIKRTRSGMLVRLGWQTGINLHNFLILGAYLLLGGAAVMGLPWHLTWPGLLTLPLSVFQLYLMHQITSGVKPKWRAIRLVAMTLPGLFAYLTVIALWTG